MTQRVPGRDSCASAASSSSTTTRSFRLSSYFNLSSSSPTACPPPVSADASLTTIPLVANRDADDVFNHPFALPRPPLFIVPSFVPFSAEQIKQTATNVEKAGEEELTQLVKEDFDTTESDLRYAAYGNRLRTLLRASGRYVAYTRSVQSSSLS
jgi:hypothetical protein